MLMGRRSSEFGDMLGEWGGFIYEFGDLSRRRFKRGDGVGWGWRSCMCKGAFQVNEESLR